MACEICEHAMKLGSWPTSHVGTHCMDCHRSWAAYRQSHCTVCHAHFSADSVGDRHRVGGECLTRDEMLVLVSKAGNPIFRMDTTKDGDIWRSGDTLNVKPAFLVRQGR